MKEQSLDVRAGDHAVPATLWTPDGPGDRPPVVLLGHGASQHKGGAGLQPVVHRLVERHGCAAIAIDGPVHGDRHAGPARAAAEPAGRRGGHRFRAELGGPGTRPALDHR